MEFDGDGWMVWWQLPSFEELATDIPNFYKEIRKHCGADAKALELTSRLVKIAGRVDLKEFQELWSEKRKGTGNDKDALDQVFEELESRDPVSR